LGHRHIDSELELKRKEISQLSEKYIKWTSVWVEGEGLAGRDVAGFKGNESIQFQMAHLFRKKRDGFVWCHFKMANRVTVKMTGFH
jgi:hypothetical protein